MEERRAEWWEGIPESQEYKGKDVNSFQGEDLIHSAQHCREVQQDNRLKICQLALVTVAMTLANVPSGEYMGEMLTAQVLRGKRFRLMEMVRMTFAFEWGKENSRAVAGEGQKVRWCKGVCAWAHCCLHMWWGNGSFLNVFLMEEHPYRSLCVSSCLFPLLPFLCVAHWAFLPLSDLLFFSASLSATLLYLLLYSRHSQPGLLPWAGSATCHAWLRVWAHVNRGCSKHTLMPELCDVVTILCLAYNMLGLPYFQSQH